MIEILVVRHGRPACDYRTRIRGRDLGQWAEAYEHAPLDLALAPPAELVVRAATIPLVVTSTIRRARDSAALVAPGRPALNDPLFDEAGLPTSIELGVALRPIHWGALARVAWLLGWSGDVESLREATSRAARAADRLAGLALTHGSVMLVGHGMLNTLICRELRRAGWKGTGSPRTYWGRVALRSSGTAVTPLFEDREPRRADRPPASRPA